LFAAVPSLLLVGIRAERLFGDSVAFLNPNSSLASSLIFLMREFFPQIEKAIKDEKI
jgi:hypothetical protein